MIEPAAIRILIVDDHEGVRLGLATALRVMDDLLVVGAATSGAGALQLCAQVKPDVVLMEIQLPDRDGVGLIQQIRRQFPRIQVVVLTTMLTTDLKQHATSAGARDYLAKYVSVADLIEVIRAAHAETFAEGASRCTRDQTNRLEHDTLAINQPSCYRVSGA